MPASTVSDAPPPSVTLSFANNFWGKDDAGVTVLLERMHHAKVTCDEMKSFYAARTAIEEEYAKKLLSLSRKPLGSCEAGTLRMSLDVVRGEVEAMGKSHQNIAQQMKTELDEQLAAFAGGMKERRKIVQTGIEKLHKLKMQQTQTANKARDRFEQDCLKIKGYLAQGHMVMGQEERKNKAKLEKTQIQLSTSQNEYETAIKVLEETTGRWNRDWKAACDKFQDLEEERIDFLKSSLWSFANVASTVCVSDDASCEKVRLSLEDCDVEKDIVSFIKGSGTGQEIPDPPKFINFCRGDINDTASEDEDEAYSVAQFQRQMNPSYRSSSPQPSTFESHHDPDNSLARDMGLTNSYGSSGSAEATPRKPVNLQQSYGSDDQTPRRAAQNAAPQHPDDVPRVPHNEYPMDGMTQFCRMDPPSERSSVNSPVRPGSSGSISDYSNPTSFSSADPSLLSQSPSKLNGSDVSMAPSQEKKRSGFFNNRSPFRRKSKGEKDRPQNRTTWAGPQQGVSTRHYGGGAEPERSVSPEPVDPRANFQLNVGNNVFDIASPDAPKAASKGAPNEQLDPIAQALADLKVAGKHGTSRVSADRYAGIQTPAPPGSATSGSAQSTMRGKPAGGPPSYAAAPASHLGAPQPAFTSRQMQQTTQRYVDQKQNMFNAGSRYGPSQQAPVQKASPQSRPGTRGGSSMSNERAPSPSPYRSTSPRPGSYGAPQGGHMPRAASPNPYGGAAPRGNLPRAASPNPYLPDGGRGQNRNRAQSISPTKAGYENRVGGYGVQAGLPRATSPQPQFSRSADRPASRNSNMAVQLAPVEPGQEYGAPQYQARGRPMSAYGGAGVPVDQRTRSKSMAPDGRQYTRDGRPILHFSRAMYMYQAAIPEELSFKKGDMLAVLRHQEDGWYEAEVVGQAGRSGLVPSNYLGNA